LEKELANLRPTRRAQSAMDAEKRVVDDIQKLAKRSELARTEMEKARRANDPPRGRISIRKNSRHEKQLKDSKPKPPRATKVTHACCRKKSPRGNRRSHLGWTGIPVSRLMEAERELLRLDQILTNASSARTKAVQAVADAVIRGAQRPQRSEATHRLVHLPRPDRRGQNRLARALAQSLFDTRTTWSALT